jgi:hypothetical protein
MVTAADHELSLCVEVAVADASWMDDLPPAPVTAPITVTFDDAGLAGRDADAIEELGYRYAGIAPVHHAHQVAHVTVTWDLVARHPRWWRALLAVAQRVYDLRFGPVQQALREVLDVHATARRTAPGAKWLEDGTRPRPSA